MTDYSILSLQKQSSPQDLELRRLIACYQIANRDDKNVVWAALNKYLPLINVR